MFPGSHFPILKSEFFCCIVDGGGRGGGGGGGGGGVGVGVVVVGDEEGERLKKV